MLHNEYYTNVIEKDIGGKLLKITNFSQRVELKMNDFFEDELLGGMSEEFEEIELLGARSEETDFYPELLVKRKDFSINREDSEKIVKLKKQKSEEKYARRVQNECIYIIDDNKMSNLKEYKAKDEIKYLNKLGKFRKACNLYFEINSKNVFRLLYNKISQKAYEKIIENQKFYDNQQLTEESFEEMSKNVDKAMFEKPESNIKNELNLAGGYLLSYQRNQNDSMNGDDCDSRPDTFVDSDDLDLNYEEILMPWAEVYKNFSEIVEAI